MKHWRASREDLGALAKELVGLFHQRQVLFLEGDLGAGKTTLVSEIVQSLGGQNAMSPTYAFHNVYTADVGEIDHLDLYRLETEQELELAGFWDLFAKPAGLILIEWPEKMSSQLIPTTWELWRLSIRGEGELRDYQLEDIRA